MSTPQNAIGLVPRIRVWDGLTRLTHWSLVVLVPFSWWSAESGHMDYHRYSGYALLGAVVFRLFWGFFGSTTARFASFVKGPLAIWRYVRAGGSSDLPPGHNPLGALSVLALLALLTLQIGLGLFSVDVDGLESGPWSHLVTFEAGRIFARLHRLVFEVLETCIIVHVAAVVFYWIARRNNLIAPMITGWRTWHGDAMPHVRFAPRWVAVVGITLAAALVIYVT